MISLQDYILAQLSPLVVHAAVLSVASLWWKGVNVKSIRLAYYIILMYIIWQFSFQVLAPDIMETCKIISGRDALCDSFHFTFYFGTYGLIVLFTDIILRVHYKSKLSRFVIYIFNFMFSFGLYGYFAAVVFIDYV